jgi:predicted enzyme related to lactoylglutathione lyase
MPERTEYAHGTPSWVDVQTTDTAAAKQFYGGLFGWSYDDQPTPEGPIYSMATINGKHVAAIAPMPPGADGIPPHWNQYVTVGDVDATVSRVPDAGGTVIMPAFDVMDAGRMALIADPSGATLCLWQPKNNIGAQIVNEPNTFSWSELLTPDVPKAAAFYTKIFGWDPQPFGDSYTVFNLDGNGIGGAMNPPMPQTPPSWLVYFTVTDADATAAKAAELGGSVMAPPFDIPEVGRAAVLTYPQGAVFANIKNAQQLSLAGVRRPGGIVVAVTPIGTQRFCCPRALHGRRGARA